MVGVATIKLVGLFSWLAAAVFSTIDPVWATPLNTLLLLVTVLVGAIINRKVNRVEDKQQAIDAKADAIHKSVGHAAAASASAAEAAATSARIAKEVGGQIRNAPTGNTDATDGGGV